MSGKSFLVSTSGDRQVLTIPEVGAEHNNGTVECVAENEVGKCSCACSLKIIKGIRDDIIVGTVRA